MKNEVIDNFFRSREGKRLSECGFAEEIRLTLHAYFNHVVLPANRRRYLPKDILVFGGHGSGKSTFAQNWEGHPVLLKGAYHYYKQRLSSALESTFGDNGRVMNALEMRGMFGNDLSNAFMSFFEWSNLPAIFDTSSAMFGRRDLRRVNYLRRAEIPLKQAHILFNTPDIAAQRIEQRAENGGHHYTDRDGKFFFSCLQSTYACPVVAMNCPETLLWDCREDGAMKLMGVIQNSGSKATIHIIDAQALANFQLTRETIEKMWSLANNHP